MQSSATSSHASMQQAVGLLEACCLRRASTMTRQLDPMLQKNNKVQLGRTRDDGDVHYLACLCADVLMC
jgi:hypothetical protein